MFIAEQGLPGWSQRIINFFLRRPEPQDQARATMRFEEHILGKMPPFFPRKRQDSAKGTGAFRDNGLGVLGLRPARVLWREEGV